MSITQYNLKNSDYQYTESEKKEKDKMTNSWEMNLEQTKQSELMNTYYYDHKHSRMYTIHPCDCRSEINANSILSFDMDDIPCSGIE